MAEGDPVVTPPTDDDPTKAELAALRKEKADREASDRATKDSELEELRKYKAEQESKASRHVTTPTKKVDKPDPVVTPATTPPKAKRGGPSRAWFGETDD
jgi:hypothetical protein